jgi:hypothetical protein
MSIIERPCEIGLPSTRLYSVRPTSYSRQTIITAACRMDCSPRFAATRAVFHILIYRNSGSSPCSTTANHTLYWGMPKNTHAPEPASDGGHRSFKFFAVTNASLTSGELVEFHVDSHGKITSAKFDFIYNTPRLAKFAKQ